MPAPSMSSAETSVRLVGVSAGYGGRPAIVDVDVSFRAGRLTAIFGPNGGGKSTLLKVIAGLLRQWTGDVTVLGAAPGAMARRVAYVPQAEAVDWGFPVSAWDVVMMGRYPALGPLRRPGSADRDAVAAALAQVGMAAHTRTQIGSLSGGQRRRVFLARAIAAAPDLYLLDEPVTGVDVTTQEDLLDILEAEADRGRTVIATTHDLACAAQRFQDVVAMNRTVVAEGQSSLVLDRDVLNRTYGGHILVLGEQAIMLDDAHHHDQPGVGARHYHDDAHERGG
jgi:ABC-type Mn2+/Zn2+ transport system ATPase subunit